MSFEQKQALSGKNIQPANPITNSSNISNANQDGSFIYHTIKKGDNLWLISKKYEGVSDVDIMRLNNLTIEAARNLKPGDILKIKRKI
jgi:membrane-bound lytic murein transglycosylase D